MIKLLPGFAALAALVGAPLWAHHSAAAEFDAARLLVLTGTITKVEWTNPHVHCHLAVKDAGGAAVDWYFEMASPNGMRRQGWQPNTMKPGDRVTIEAFAAKDYPTAAKAHRVKVADGRWLFVDSSGPGGRSLSHDPQRPARILGEAQTGLDAWLKRATRSLPHNAAASVRAEIAEDDESAREAALAALGDAEAANGQSRRVLLTGACMLTSGLGAGESSWL